MWYLYIQYIVRTLTVCTVTIESKHLLQLVLLIYDFGCVIYEMDNVFSALGSFVLNSDSLTSLPYLSGRFRQDQWLWRHCQDDREYTDYANLGLR